MLTEYFKEQGVFETITEPSDPRYTCIDTGGVETEIGEFLYGFIRAIKPEKVLTTGVYSGVSDLYIAKALQDNGSGHITALEIDASHIERAKKMWDKAGLGSFITTVLGSSLEFLPRDEYDFTFLDTEPSIRLQEFIRFYDFIKEGSFTFIHDMPRTLCQGNLNPDHPEFPHWPVGEVPGVINQWLSEGQIRFFNLPTPRDILGIYKVHENDYKFKKFGI